MCLTVPFRELEPSQGRADLAVLCTLLHGHWRGQEQAKSMEGARSPHLRVTRVAWWRYEPFSTPVLWQRLAGGQAPGHRLLSRERVVLRQHTYPGGRHHTGTPRITKTLGQKPKAYTFNSEMDFKPNVGVGKSKPLKVY